MPKGHVMFLLEQVGAGEEYHAVTPASLPQHHGDGWEALQGGQYTEELGKGFLEPPLWSVGTEDLVSAENLWRFSLLAR